MGEVDIPAVTCVGLSVAAAVMVGFAVVVGAILVGAIVEGAVVVIVGT